MTYQQVTKKFKTLDHIMVVGGSAAPCILFLSMIITATFHTGYSHFRQAISVLGAQGAPAGWILNVSGLIPAGLLTCLFSITMFRHLRGGRALFISSCFVMIIGVGRTLAGIFPCDPGCLPIISASGKIHAISGMVALFAGCLAPLAMSFGKLRLERLMFYLSISLGLTGLVLFGILISPFSVQYFGSIQRLLITVTYTWIITVGAGILKKSRNHQKNLPVNERKP